MIKEIKYNIIINNFEWIDKNINKIPSKIKNNLLLYTYKNEYYLPFEALLDGTKDISDKTIIEILKIYKSVNQEDTVLFKKLKDKKYSTEKAENIINYSHEFYSQQDMHDKKELSEYIHFLYSLVIKNKSGRKKVNAVKKI